MVKLLEKSWHHVLQDEIAKPYVGQLKSFLIKEQEAGAIIYPPEPLVFNAFAHTPFDSVKVVIVGQDPYHGAGQAHGLSFSVPSGVSQPPSLKNIFKELQNDLGIAPPAHGSLERWARQGVLMLNATLTVRAGSPRSHHGQGWEQFTDAVIARLLERETPTVFILWGKIAQEKVQNVLSQDRKHPHAVLVSAHPSPYSATGFFGCRHFSQANSFLNRWGRTPIDWNLN